MGLYEIKIKKKWVYARAESMIVLNELCKRNKLITDWRVCGMMSRSELLKVKDAKHISLFI